MNFLQFLLALSIATCCTIGTAKQDEPTSEQLQALRDLLKKTAQEEREGQGGGTDESPTDLTEEEQMERMIMQQLMRCQRLAEMVNDHYGEGMDDSDEDKRQLLPGSDGNNLERKFIAKKGWFRKAVRSVGNTISRATRRIPVVRSATRLVRSGTRLVRSWGKK